MCNCDATTLGRFLELASKVLLRLPTDRELAALDSALAPSSDVPEVEHLILHEQGAHDTPLASLERYWSRCAAKDSSQPRKFQCVREIEGRFLCQSEAYALPTEKVANSLHTVKG